MRLPTTPTYRMAVIQSRANRAFKAKLSQLLKQHNVTMMQWTIIGLVGDAKKDGLRISDLAAELDTSMAFITTTVNMLEAKGIVDKTSHDRDSRAKIVRLSNSFRPKVAAIETDLNKHVQTWLTDKAEPKDLSTYFSVLNVLAED